MTPGQERAVWRLFYLLSQCVGHEHVAEDRDVTRRFCRIAEAFYSRDPESGKVRKLRVAEDRVETLEHFVKSMETAAKRLPPSEERKWLLSDAAKVLAKKRKVTP